MNQFVASDGAQIFYSDQGSGRPLVLLHGLMAHGRFFRAQAPLADAFRLIAVDLRGHGQSAQAGSRPRMDRLARDVTELVEALDLHDAIGIGWSLGATLLWHVLAGPAAGRFAGAVVVDMTARVLNGADWTLGLSAEACEGRSAAMDSDFEKFAAGAGRAIFAQPVAPDLESLADWSAGEFARNDAASIAAIWESLVEDDARPLLPRIAHPMLVVHGSRSGLYGADTADHLVAALPNATALAFERSGHAPHLEEPELFNAAIKDFADRLSAARPAPVHTI